VRSVLEAGFIFWGLFGVFALIVVLYLLWMWWVETREEVDRRIPPAERGGATPRGGRS